MKKYIRSSWNSNRVAACCANSVRKPLEACSPKMYTEYRAATLKVVTRRGSVKFEHTYTSPVASACVVDGELRVTLENGVGLFYGYDGSSFVCRSSAMAEPVLAEAVSEPSGEAFSVA